MQCDICKRATNGVSILGLMPWEKQLEKSVKVCLECGDLAPCGTKGSWNHGQLTCKHGYRFKREGDWVVLGEKAILLWRVVGMSWLRKLLNLFKSRASKERMLLEHTKENET